MDGVREFLIILGSYNFNIEEMTLSHDELEVVLEPKVFEVLLYLYNNPARFISMDELHENVWQGRCVSDAAVRRTISKLRTLFNDDHKVPQYIKSLPKRGYKLICQISSSSHQTDNSALDIDRPSDVVLLSGHQSSSRTEYDATPNNTVRNIFYWLVTFNKNGARRIIALFLVCIFILLLIMTIVNNGFGDSQALKGAEKKISRDVILALPGEKIAIAQSADKQFLAFTGQVNQQSGYQVYLKKTDVPNFIPVTHHAYLPMGLAFSADNNQLFYSDFKQGRSSLNSISLTGAMTGKIETLLDNYSLIGDVFTSWDPNYVYFSGQRQLEQPRYIYRYNLKTQSVERITSSSKKAYIDIKGAISPDGKLMAVFRYSNEYNSGDIRVIDLVSKDVIFKHNQEQMIYDIQWFNNEQLLLLDEDKLYTLHYNDSANITLLENTPKLAAIIVIDPLNIIGLSMPIHTDKMLFIEQALPFQRWFTNHIYTTPPGSYFLGYQSDDDSKLILSYNEQITRLGKLNTKTNQITPYIQTEDSLSVLASSLGILELIKLKNRFALYNTETQTITYITSGDDFIGEAIFSTDKKNILFSIKNYDGWQILKYNIDRQTTEKLLSGFPHIRAYGENYILATANGWLFWYDSVNNEQVALNYQLSDEPNTNWDVTSHYIYWSSHDLVQTVFHQLDISDVAHPYESIKTFNYNEVRPSFNINHEGSSLIYRQREESRSQLIRLSMH